MSILAGAFWRHTDQPIDDAICRALHGAISRHPGDEIHSYRDARAYLALVDVGAYGAPAFRRDPSGSVSILAGEPLLRLDEDDATHERTHDLERLHESWDRGDWDVLRHADGTFCAAHYHPASTTLTLIADKLGVRVLYYWIGERCVVFASALRILEQVTQVPKHLNLRAVTELAALGMPLGDRTPYEEIALLHAAEVVRITPAAVSRARYWRWDDVAPSRQPETALLRMAHDRFRQGVARRAGSDTAVVAFLSGGLDSRVITAALRMQGVDVRTFNFARPGTQDAVFARQFAAAIGAHHREVALPAGIEDTRRKVMLAPLMVAAGESDDHPVARPRLVWSGDGGSVGFGHVYMSRAVVDTLRAGRRTEAIARFLRERGMAVAHRVLRGAFAEQIATTPARGIEEELDDIHCDDPGRSFYLFLMLNDQRRHLTRHFEDMDLHRLEFHLPFFDGRFLTLVASLPVDWCLEHRFYTRWLDHFPPAVTAVPWQTYPGHVPCPVPPPAGVRYQWEPTELASITAARKQTLLHQAHEMLTAASFPHDVLRHGYLRLTTLLYRAGIRDYGYVIADANTYYTHWQRCTGTTSGR